MAPELNTTSSNDADKHKNLDQEVREMIGALTNRLGGLHRSHKPGSSSSQALDNDDEQGVRIITLAGNNLGATMRGDVDNKATAGNPPETEDDTAAYVVNSNFQAINNSIMLGGSYKTNDPGVHLDVADYVDQNDVVLAKKKGRKSRRGGGHHHVERSDNLSNGDGTDTEKN